MVEKLEFSTGWINKLTTHMPIDLPLEKAFCLIFPELHRYELHCPVNYYKCFISLQTIDNLPLVLILVSALTICPLHSKILAAAFFASYR